jgi:uncharacterized membrane protein YccC
MRCCEAALSLEYTHADTPIRRNAETPKRRYPDTPILRYPDTPIPRYALNTRIPTPTRPQAHTPTRSVWRAFLALQFDNAQPTIEWFEGLRGAVGIAVPSAIGLLAGNFIWGILCSFATLWVLFCDVGGAYRQKAVTLVASCIALFGAYMFGGWMTLSVPNYLIGMFLWVFIAAIIGVTGSGAAQAGTVSSTIVITSIVLFVRSEMWIRALLCIVGFSWALFLCLGLWPLTPYAPVFQVCSVSVARLADLATTFWAGAAAPGQSANNLPFAIAYDGLMTSLERARDIWGAVRARRAGPSKRSIALLALLEQVDDVARSLVTLREELNVVGQEKWFVELRERFKELTDALSELSKGCCKAVALAGHLVDPTRLQFAFQALERDLTSEAPSATVVQRRDIYRTTRHLIDQAVALADSVAELKTDSKGFREPPEARFGTPIKTFYPLAEIRGSLSFRSSNFRHALRLGLATATAGFLASTQHLIRGYWIPMTAVIVLKPNFGGTLQRSLQRITGSVLGALIAVLFVLDLQAPWLLWSILPVLAFCTFAWRNYNYTLFSLAQTPLILLMLDIAHPITVIDSLSRVLNTILGSAVALLAGYILFPTSERRGLPIRLAEALEAEAILIRALRDAMLGKEERPISEFRRAAAIAVSNAGAAGQRLLTEPPRRRGDVEASLATVNYCRRIMHALAALTDYPTREEVHHEWKALADLFQALSKAWTDLADDLRNGREPKQLPDLLALLEDREIAALARPVSTTESQTFGEPDADQNASLALYYHLRNAINLTLRLREVIVRMLRGKAGDLKDEG